jgi:hypothetical protein
VKKLILMVAITLLFTGCLYQNIKSSDIEKARLFCEDKGGIHTMTSWCTSSIDVECNDGTWMNLNRLTMAFEDGKPITVRSK